MDELYNIVMAYEPYHKIALATLGFVIVALVLVYRAFLPIQYPKDLPRIGAREGISWDDMRKKYMTDCLAVFDDAYENVSQATPFRRLDT
jgi:hypothetical protein